MENSLKSWGLLLKKSKINHKSEKCKRSNIKYHSFMFFVSSFSCQVFQVEFFTLSFCVKFVMLSFHAKFFRLSFCIKFFMSSFSCKVFHAKFFRLGFSCRNETFDFLKHYDIYDQSCQFWPKLSFSTKIAIFEQNHYIWPKLPHVVKKCHLLFVEEFWRKIIYHNVWFSQIDEVVN